MLLLALGLEVEVDDDDLVFLIIPVGLQVVVILAGEERIFPPVVRAHNRISDLS